MGQAAHTFHFIQRVYDHQKLVREILNEVHSDNLCIAKECLDEFHIIIELKDLSRKLELEILAQAKHNPNCISALEPHTQIFCL